jgi:phage terminase large subunit-like protein
MALLDAFQTFCDHLTVESGAPLALEPWQFEVVKDLFTHMESLVLLPKANGKSSLLGALALFHLATTPDARVYVAAASRDQATLLFNYAHGFLNRSINLQNRLVARPGYREIRSKRDLGFIKVLASDVDTTDGTGATLALVDELHRHKSADLYGSLRDGLGKRGGSLVTISTAGASEVSPLGFLRTAAMELSELERHGAHTRAASSTFCMHEWSVPDGADCHDLEIVKQANPSSFVTIEALRARHDSPSMRELEWQRFACNRWVADEGSQVIPLGL